MNEHKSSNSLEDVEPAQIALGPLPVAVIAAAEAKTGKINTAITIAPKEAVL